MVAAAPPAARATARATVLAIVFIFILRVGVRRFLPRTQLARDRRTEIDTVEIPSSVRVLAVGLLKRAPKVFKPAIGTWGRQGCTSVLLESASVAVVRLALAAAAGNITTGKPKRKKA